MPNLALQRKAAIGSMLALLFASANAQAQPDAGTLLNQQERQQQRLPGRLQQPDIQPLRPALKETTGLKVKVKAVRFSGATQLASNEALQAVVADVIGKELDFAGLEQLAARVQVYLRKQGAFLAQAYLPKQDVTDGVIEISLREGRLDGRSGKGEPFTITPGGKLPLRIDLARLKAIAAATLPAGVTASSGDIERGVLLMNDLPGIAARAHLEPGSEPDSTRVAIDVDEGPLFSGLAYIDNYGNRDTGTGQLNLGAEWRDPFHVGDLISLNATHTQGLDLGRIGYALPLGSRGLKLNTSWTRMDYEIIRGTGLAAGLKGSSETANLSLSYPLLRSRSQNANVALGYVSKTLVDDSTAGKLRDKRLDNWSLTLSGDRLDDFAGGGFNNGSLAVTFGHTDLGRNAGDAATDASTYRTAGDFTKLNLGLSRLQRLPGSFSLAASLSAQSANKNLDSSEKFILGGPNGVRAYPGSEGMGDAGWLANFELRYDLPAPTAWGNVQLIGFYDTGRITLHHDTYGIANATATGDNVYGLSGWGLCATLSKLGSHSLRLQWARKIGSNPGRSIAGLDADSRADTSRLWLQAVAWF